MDTENEGAGQLPGGAFAHLFRYTAVGEQHHLLNQEVSLFLHFQIHAYGLAVFVQFELHLLGLEVDGVVVKALFS